MMKHQILKSVACIAFVSLLSVKAMALEASEGIEGYRGGDLLADGTKKVEGIVVDATKDYTKKQKENIEKQVKKVSEGLNEGMGSISNGVEGLNANKILDLGGNTQEFLKKANDGAKSFKVLDGYDFGRSGTTGDRWLDYFYGSDVDKNLDQYLGDNLQKQLSDAGSSSAFDDYYRKAQQTYERGTIAKEIYDDTGVDNGDLWMFDYIPSVAVGEGILRSQQGESLGSVNAALTAGKNIKDATLSMQDFSEMKKDLSLGDATEVNDIGQKMMDNAKEEAGRMLSLDAMRFMNEDALGDMNNKLDTVSFLGAGIPTMDILNLIVGMYNVDSVYAGTDQNAAGKAAGTYQVTRGIQVGEYKSCVTSGKKASECCTQVAGGIKNGPAVDSKRTAVSYKQCCVAMTGKEDCTPPAQQEKKECLQQQQDIATGWTMCDITCRNTDFGDLIHKKMADGETKWDESMIDDLLEECGVGESDWVPSPTVLTSAELAAVVPETIKEGLVKR